MCTASFKMPTSTLSTTHAHAPGSTASNLQGSEWQLVRLWKAFSRAH